MKITQSPWIPLSSGLSLKLPHLRTLQATVVTGHRSWLTIAETGSQKEQLDDADLERTWLQEPQDVDWAVQGQAVSSGSIWA